MSNQFRSLDRIRIASACEADWDTMIGNDSVRFCEHCKLHVNDLSAMTQATARRLLAQSNGRICVRYIARPDGGVQRSPEKLYRINRRVSRLAAGAFTATLSLASTTAQTPTAAEVTSLPVSQLKADRISHDEASASLSGSVTDPLGAPVRGATVNVVNDADNISFTATTGDDGAYSLSFLPPGVYTITATGGGLAQKEVMDLILKEHETRSMDLNLDLPLVMFQVEVREIVVETSIQGGAIFISAQEPLAKAAAENDLATVRQLVFASPNINVQDPNTNMTALDHAVENGNFEITRTLLAAGANVLQKNQRNRTALMYLRESATPELVRELLAAGAKVNAHDQDGETVLMNAVASGGVAVVRLLTEAGAKIDAQDKDGKTVLMFAIRNEDPRVPRLLIDLGADPNTRNADHETPLMVAAEEGSALTVKALLEAGAEVNAKDKQGFTALMNAAAQGNLESVKLLLNAGADASAQSAGLDTALALARKFEKVDVVEFLKSHGAPE